MSLLFELIGLLIVIGIARRLFDAWDQVDRADDHLEQR